MASLIKDLIVPTCDSQKVIQTLSCLSIVVLVSLLCLGTNSAAIAVTVRFPDTESAMIIAQQGDSKIPPVVVNSVRQDLARRTNIATDKLKLKSATRQTWPNGCLGLAASDEICTQALVEGWRVVMSYKNQTWVYRTDSQGRVIRMEK
ncbi:hypothetical protein [Gloeothece verrucosa]|uniref:Uncharacterized protein n=1 Tax=Gloeothece verrucosa (strain PCC 7822) TaxID=497965 RepID=E0UB57_GLOV7|nr:hypothetical protein [Gloeothece verrucosa]ADN16302.1 hypothetical protein Cyan7822_4388 [Gloeothece verrucosa PCC 7822]